MPHGLAAAPVMLQSLLVQAFEASGKIASVAADTSALHSGRYSGTDIRDSGSLCT